MKRQKQDVTQKGQRKSSVLPQVCLLGRVNAFQVKGTSFQFKALACSFPDRQIHLEIYTYML